MISYSDIKEVLRKGARSHFWLFCLYYDWEFFTKRPFLKTIALGMQKVYDEFMKGKAIKLSASLPPRAGKSYIASCYCAWWLGKLPEQSIMRNACTATLYRKFSYDVRNIVKSEKYKAVFPEIQLADDKQNLDGWNLSTSKQVGYFGSGVGGTIIGFGANLALSDDLYRGIEDALSETYNDGVIRWKESTHDSRKEKNCPEIFIGTRWSKRDVIGQAIENGKIDIEIKVPALVVGEDGKLRSFCEDVKSTEEYLDIQDSIDETIFMAEYQQEPVENKGLLFPKSEMKFYDPDKIDLSLAEFAYMQMDAADEGGDFYAAPVCLLIENAIYVPEVIFSTDGTDATEPETILLATQYKLNAAQFEGNGGWVSMGKNIRNALEPKLPDCEYRIIKNTTNKETRILAHAAFIKRNIYFRQDYKEHRQYHAFMNNLIGYLREGGNKHDDAPDVMAGVANYFKTQFDHVF